MRAFMRFMLFLLVLVIIIGVFFRLAQENFSGPERPERIPTYDEVVPKGFSAENVPRVLDAREAGPLLDPRLGVVRVGDAIASIACPRHEQRCVAEAITQWIKQNLEYVEVLPSREHIISPDETLLYREGDALTLSILQTALLRGQGFPARLGVTRYTAFTEAAIGGDTVRFEPSCGNCDYGQAAFEDEPLYWVD